MVCTRIRIKYNLLTECCGIDMGLLNGQSVSLKVRYSNTIHLPTKRVPEAADHFVLTVFSWCSVCCAPNRVLRGT